MAAYSDYRLRLRLLSPLGTPMQSDMLFGHLAWQAAWRGGDEGVAAFLKPFLAGEPPFVLSDAFPAGLLPRPQFSEPPSVSAAQDRREFAASKRRLKAPFVSADDFVRLLAGPADIAPMDSPWVFVETLHARIDRSTDTTTPGGQLFATQAQSLADGYDGVDVYVRALDGWRERIMDMFAELSRTGFGRDKSAGSGAFEVVSMDTFPCFSALNDANGFVSLSTYMPKADDPTEGRWRLRVKRGYLGEMAGDGNPWKRTMIQLEPGAVFQTGGAPKPWYGRMVRDIAPGMPRDEEHGKPGAVQCGLTLAVPCRWTGRGG